MRIPMILSTVVCVIITLRARDSGSIIDSLTRTRLRMHTYRCTCVYVIITVLIELEIEVPIHTT